MSDYLDSGPIPGAEGPTSVGGAPLSGGDSSFDPLSLGMLGAGAAGLGAMLMGGPGGLPPQAAAASNLAMGQAQMGGQMFGQGTPLVAQGTQALGMAQRGELTPEQQAQLRQYSTGLESQARQQFYNMGVNPDANTAFITQQGNIDTQINAMAQKQIETTIQLGLGEIGAGYSLESGGVQAISAADQTLIAAADLQIKQDQAYSQALTAAFTSVGKMFGAYMQS